jgi:Ni,Fe-hydrogenase I small subunit
MTAKPLNPNFWEVTDSAGRQFGISRIVSAGNGCSACACGGYWDERSSDEANARNTCEHIQTVECAVTAPGVLKQIINGAVRG